MHATGSVLLDTNILIAYLAADPAVTRGVHAAALVYVPAIALGELDYGARKSGRVAENVARVDTLAATNMLTMLACDAGTAPHYGEIKMALRRAGTPIPQNDIWIAALARQHALPLASRDAHFQRIADLDIVTWRA